ncbi:MAG: GTP-binding protein [Anaerovoracaceae bacterium]
MERINVLVMGDTGVGKSTLINAVLGREAAPTGYGDTVTHDITVYEDDDIPFRLIDTPGIEHYGQKNDGSRLRTGLDIWTGDRGRMQREIRKYIASIKIPKFGGQSGGENEGAGSQEAGQAGKSGSQDNIIHVIWFCISGQSRRLTEADIEQLWQISRRWPQIPIIVVMTQSYFYGDDEANEAMFLDTLERSDMADQLNVKCIMPVVAKEAYIDENVIAAPRGLEALIEKTNELIPDAQKLGEENMNEMRMKLKRSMAMGIVWTATASAGVIGAVPVKVSDSALLMPLQSGMLWAVERVYGTEKDSDSRDVVNTILDLGGTTIAGRTLYKALCVVPGLNAAGSALNAIVASSVTYTAGSICVDFIEKDMRGEIDKDKVSRADYLAKSYGKRIEKYSGKLSKALKDKNAEDVVKNIKNILSGK